MTQEKTQKTFIYVPNILRAYSFLGLLLALPLLSACTAATAPQQQANTPDPDRQAAQLKLDRIMAEKQWRAQQEETAFQEAQQRAEQRDAQRLAEAQKPHYPAAELEAAARPRKWASIKVPDLNISTVLNTTWKDGRLNYRVAMLGQRSAIDTFTSQWQAYNIDFADQSGTNIFQFRINPADFQWSNVNGGIPTKEMTSSIECDLPRYEQSVQWNLTWAQ